MLDLTKVEGAHLKNDRFGGTTEQLNIPNVDISDSSSDEDGRPPNLAKKMAEQRANEALDDQPIPANFSKKRIEIVEEDIKSDVVSAFVADSISDKPMF
jgi:hypothetical protein